MRDNDEIEMDNESDYDSMSFLEHVNDDKYAAQGGL